MAILAPARVANGAPRQAAAGLTTTVQARGMEMSFSIPPGPYFLGELLRTTVSLANISGKPIAYAGNPWDVPSCGSTLQVALTGGVASLFDLFSGLNLCATHPGPAIGCSLPGSTLGTLISQGQRITLHPLVALTASGQITLTAWVTFISCKIRNHASLMGWGTGPFGSALPAFQMNVAPTAPANKVLHQVRTGTRISIQPPYINLPGVMADWEQGCAEAANPNPFGAAGWTSSGGWTPMVNNTVVDPLCPSGHGKLVVAVGAPGFRIDKEVYCQSPLNAPVFTTGFAPPCTRIVH
jgi:hypothetical protein